MTFLGYVVYMSMPVSFHFNKQYLQKITNWIKNHRRQLAEDDDVVEAGDRRLMTTWTGRKGAHE